MTFTKIAAAGIGSTETVTLHSLEVLNNATVGGVLTYEDVTNVDSIGIITARSGVLVGSGITLSKDGDIFATGVTTTGSLVSSGAVSGTTGTFSSAVSGTTGTFSSAVSGTSGTFTGGIDVTSNVTITDSIVHSGDTNTKIRFPEADKVTVETSGTERLAIEPAGSVNIPKSVNVGSGLTVGGLGAGTSLSTFVGQGFLELTRSSGDAFIDFKNSFAGDDFDCRIITNASNQLQLLTGGHAASAIALQTNTGKVAISTVPIGGAPTIAILQIHSDKLGGVAGTGYTSGNSQELLYLTSPDISNATSYRFTNVRHTTGTSHTQSEGRLRRHVDVTDQGYFGLGDGYASIGYGTAEKARFTYDGKFGLGLTSPVGQFAVSDGTVVGEINPYQSSSTCFIGTRSNHSLTLKTNATGRLTIDTDGYIKTPTQPYVMAAMNSQQTIPANTTIEVIFDSESYDTANGYNTSNGRFTCPVVGDYLVTFDCQYTGIVNNFHLGVGVNGTNPPGSSNFDLWNHTGNARGDNMARILRITAVGQYISFFTYSSGGTLEANRTKMTIKFLG